MLLTVGYVNMLEIVGDWGQTGALGRVDKLAHVCTRWRFGVAVSEFRVCTHVVDCWVRAYDGDYLRILVYLVIASSALVVPIDRTVRLGSWMRWPKCARVGALELRFQVQGFVLQGMHRCCRLFVPCANMVGIGD